MTVKKEKVRMTPFDTNRFKLKVSKQCIRTYTFTESESSGSGGGSDSRRRRLQWRRRFPAAAPEAVTASKSDRENLKLP